uniref:tRNA (34-2'-O)-methyltransferase regulator WDR6 n=1 Tax=Amphimedon queenslandica TaxID=400682 RepID=A0A1X7VGR6_AMPQE
MVFFLAFLTASYSCQVRSVSGWLLFASGTVFNDILLSSYPIHQVKISDLSPHLGSCEVAVRLKGHEGVIFCVDFNEDLSLLASSSDDRSVRIWELPQDWKLLKGHTVSNSLYVLYGHTARVWRVYWTLSSSLLLSVGEDATCRVWDHRGNCKNVISGHRGRNIWSVAFNEADNLIYTGGEDSSIRVHSLSVSSGPGQKGALYDGPRNVTVLSSRHQMFPSPPPLPPSPRSLLLWDNHLLLCLFEDGSLCQLDLSLSPPDSNWSPPCHTDPKYSKYSLMTLAKGLPLLAIGNLEGSIKILALPAAVDVCKEWTAHSGKVFSLLWMELPTDTTSSITDGNTLPVHSTEVLLSCGPAGNMICWLVDYSSDKEPIAVSLLFTLLLPQSKHRWTTAALILSIEKGRVREGGERERRRFCIACGDKKGSIHLYYCFDGQKEIQSPSQSFYGVHGPNGVTQMFTLNGSLYSVGRDGYCRQYSFTLLKTERGEEEEGADGNEVIGLYESNRFHPVRGVDWIEGVRFTVNHGTLTTCYHGNEFLLHSSVYERSIFTVTCGGGHRSYALSSLDSIIETHNVTFAYIKGSSVVIVQENLSDQLMIPVLQAPFIGREAVSICLLNTIEESSTALFAVGSEDCSIALVKAKCIKNDKGDSTLSLNPIASIGGHTSCIQSLSSLLLSDNKHCLLFSGGGRASLKAWLISTNDLKEPSVSLQCEYNLHNLPSKPQRRRRKGKSASVPPPECRITSLASLALADVSVKYRKGQSCVTAGCSDGFIRIYIYDEVLKSFTLLEVIDHHHHCILTVSNIILSFNDSPFKTALLLTAATDGSIVLWPLSSLISKWHDDQEKGREEEATPTLDPLLSIDQAHQSGINDISVILIQESLDPNLLLIASVGDDTALVISLCSVSCDSHLLIKGQCKLSSAHYSAITGVSFLSPGVLLTTSIDQRLSLWSVTVDGFDPSLAKVTDCVHNVADPSCLVSYHLKDSCYGVVCGVGMEFFELNQELCRKNMY